MAVSAIPHHIMASKRHKKRKLEAWKNRVHGTKRAYDSPRVAELTLKRLGDSEMTLYHCPFCNKFHVGRIKEHGRPFVPDHDKRVATQ